MCDEASRISRGPFRVPETYDVVRSTGTGRITTCDSSNDRMIGIVPPKAIGAACSYSNGKLISTVSLLAEHLIPPSNKRNERNERFLLGNARTIKVPVLMARARDPGDSSNQ